MSTEDKKFIKGLINNLETKLGAKIDKNSEDIKRNSEDIRKNSEDIKRNSEDIRKNSEDIKRNSEDIHQIYILAENQNDFLASIAEGITSLGTRVTRLETKAA